MAVANFWRNDSGSSSGSGSPWPLAMRRSLVRLHAALCEPEVANGVPQRSVPLPHNCHIAINCHTATLPQLPLPHFPYCHYYLLDCLSDFFRGTDELLMILFNCHAATAMLPLPLPHLHGFDAIAVNSQPGLTYSVPK
jgi:hypothetical protein